MRPIHRIERLTNLLTERIDERIDRMAEGLSSGPPPHSVKLTEREQLEQYFAMDQNKWLELIQSKGLDAAVKYSAAMLRLVRKHYPQVRPALWMGTGYAEAAAAPTPSVDTFPTSLPQTGGQLSDAAVDAVVQQALQGVM